MDRIFPLLWQLRRRWCLVITFGLLICCSCNKDGHESDELNRRLLVGTFQLQIRSSCLDRGLLSDELVLHADGRLDQHTVFKSGKRYDASDQHWSYLPGDSVSLQKWMDFTDNPTGKPGGAVLLVKLGNPQLILVNPDSDCVYVKQ